MKSSLLSKNNLEKFRVEKEISQKELANLVGIPVEMIGMIETGSVTPTIRLACTLATALDKKFGEVFFFA